MKTKFITLFCIGAALAALAAEEPMAGTWSLAGRTKQRQGWSTNGTPLTSVAVVWTNTSVSASSMLWGGAPKMGSAVTDNDRLYLSANSVASNNNGNIIALDLTTGALLWGTKLSYIYAMGTPVVTANRVYASENNDTGPGVLACLDKTTGAIIWSNAVNQIVGGALQLSDGKVYCGSKWGLEAGMHCYDAEVGTQMWLYTGANGVDNSSVSQGVQYWTDTGAALNPAGTVLYFRSERLGKIVGIDAVTGVGLYSNQYFNTVSSEGCQPVVDNAGNVYSGFDGVSAAGDPDIVVKFSPTLSQIWIYTFASDSVWGGRGAFALSPDQKTLYCANAGASGTGVTALNTADGTKKWDAGCGPTSGGIVVGAPSNIIVGVFTASGIATAKGLRDNGASVSTLWAVPLAPNTGWMGSSGSNPLLLPDGDVVVETAYGLIARIAYSPYISPTNQLTTTFLWYAGAVAANPAGVGGWYNLGDAVTLTAKVVDYEQRVVWKQTDKIVLQPFEQRAFRFQALRGQTWLYRLKLDVQGDGGREQQWVVACMT
ncbi:MAG: PQQ-binding-like beta-propeller repeat protein, partial [bacterium]|nr:PQQ-binding-like beta-propeller repeat protein [bacterium]